MCLSRKNFIFYYIFKKIYSNYMDYAIFALYGLSILFIINLYYLYKNIKKNSLIVFGSLLVTIGFLYAVTEKYNYLKNNHFKNKISISHIILGAFGLLSFIIPINTHVKKTDIFGIIGHFILINTNFGYQELANICLTIYYSLYTYRNMGKSDVIENVKAIGSGLILLYYIKKLIDSRYIQKEKSIDNIKYNNKDQ